MCIAVLRAANTGVTYDEAYTYLHYVHPGFFRSFFGEYQLLNNHVLYSLCAMILEFATNMRFSEILLRTPSLVAGAIYLCFACKLSKSFRRCYLVFALFALNVYLNEFFTLARGYGMAAACVAGALYCFERWRRDARDISMFNFCMGWFCCAALANSIALYIWCCALPVIGVLIRRAGMLKSYFKNPFNALFTAVAVVVCAFNVYVSRKGMPVYSNHDFYISIIMSIPRMMFETQIAVYIFAALAAALFAVSLVKQHVSNEYLVMLIIYAGICAAGQWIFHRGYPVDRTMLPVYPLFVLGVAKAINQTGPGPHIWIERAAMTLVVILFLQFSAKISINHTRDWSDSYLLRADVLRYIATHALSGESEDDFKNFEAGFRLNAPPGRDLNNPVISFYFGKLKYMMGRE